MNKLCLILLFSFYQSHCMELTNNNNKNPSVPSLKYLAAKKYAQYYKQLPEKPIPYECKDILKIYLPITENTIVEQYSLALTFDDQEQKEELRKRLVNNFVPEKGFILSYNKADIKRDLEKGKTAFNKAIKTYDSAFQEKHKEEYETILAQLAKKNRSEYRRAFKSSDECCCASCISILALVVWTGMFFITLNNPM